MVAATASLRLVHSKPSWLLDQTHAVCFNAVSAGIVSNIFADVHFTEAEADNHPLGDFSGSGVGNIIWDWSGGTVDTDAAELIVLGGGHLGYLGNDMYALDFLSENPSWRRIAEPVFPGGLNNPTFGVQSQAGYGDGSFSGTAPSATHTYNRPCYANKRMWLAGIDSMDDGPGNASSACYAWRRDTITSGLDVGGWEYYGIPAISNVGRFITGAAEYNRRTGIIYSFPQVPQGTGPCYSKSATDQTQGNFTLFGPDWSGVAADTHWHHWFVDEGVLLIFRGAGGVITLDINNMTNEQYPSSPGYSFPDGNGAFYHSAANRVYTWGQGLGQQIRVCDCPPPGSRLNGTYNFRLANFTGASVPPIDNGDAGSSNSVYGRFNGFEFPDGEVLLMWQMDREDDVHFMRVGAGGL